MAQWISVSVGVLKYFLYATAYSDISSEMLRHLGCLTEPS